MLQLILLILLSAIFIGVILLTRKQFMLESLKAIGIALAIIIGLVLTIRYYLIVLIIIGIVLIRLFIKGMKYQNEILQWIEEAPPYMTQAQIDTLMVPISDYIKSQDTNREDYKFDAYHLPYGRINTFLNYFHQSIYTEEVYYFSAYPSKLTEELREYGLIIARNGIYMSRQIARESAHTYETKSHFIPFAALWRVQVQQDTLKLHYINLSNQKEKILTLLQKDVAIPLTLIETICLAVIDAKIPHILSKPSSNQSDILSTAPLLALAASKVSEEYSQYHSTAADSIEILFERQVIADLEIEQKPLPIEVPRDQYLEACSLLQTRIDNNEIPGINSGEPAQNYIQKGYFTYLQVYNLAHAGVIEDLVIQDQYIYTTAKEELTNLILFAMAIWQGRDGEVFIKENKTLYTLGMNNPLFSLSKNIIRSMKIEDCTSEEMIQVFQILKEEFLDIVIQVQFSYAELVKAINELLCPPNHFKILRDLSISDNKREYARTIVLDVILSILSERKNISNQMFTYFKN